jgi:hypothetical protein
VCNNCQKNSSRDSQQETQKTKWRVYGVFFFSTHLFFLGQELVVFDGQLLLKGGYLLSEFSDGHNMVRRVGIHHGVTIDHGAEYLGWWTGIFPLTQSNLRVKRNGVNQGVMTTTSNYSESTLVTSGRCGRLSWCP